MQLVLNAIVVQMYEGLVPLVSDDPSVSYISRAIDYELALSDTVPYIGGGAVHDVGVDGSGAGWPVRPSGIDYTHANLGASGTLPLTGTPMAPTHPKTTMFQETGCSLLKKRVYPLSFSQGFNDEPWMETLNAVAESFS